MVKWGKCNRRIRDAQVSWLLVEGVRYEATVGDSHVARRHQNAINQVLCGTLLSESVKIAERKLQSLQTH